MLSRFALLFLLLAASARAQFTYVNPAGEAPGPWLFGTIGLGKNAARGAENSALKGLALKLGKNGEAGITYDLDLCRVLGVWTGGKFTTPMNLMSRGDHPTSLGETIYSTPPVPGFRTSLEPWKDPRLESFGPLEEVKFRGMFVNGGEPVLRWEIGGVEVMEKPVYGKRDGYEWAARQFTVMPHKKKIAVQITDAYEGESFGDRGAYLRYRGVNWGQKSTWAKVRGGRIGISILCELRSTFDEAGPLALPPEISRVGTGIYLVFPPDEKKSIVELASWIGEEVKAEDFAKAHRTEHPNLTDLSLARQAAPLWPESVTVEPPPAPKDDGAAYVVETIPLPEKNPWGAPMFVGGLDFFPDGRAAFCTFHGDVFVSEKPLGSGAVTWRRFAAGLYHALGLVVRGGEIFVTCRDGLWRLNDANKDGEADHYELFNGDLMVTQNFHEFVFDLHTDAAGNFYFAKAGPVKNGGRGFDEIWAHHGSLLRVSADGTRLDRIATGLRTPNGIGVGPRGELTTGDNEGTWVPACKINWVTPGGFYGVVDTAQRNPPPTTLDQPLCWLPKRADNSNGSQVWVPDDDRWGPWRGQMLHLSYGTCSLFGVTREEVSLAGKPQMQGGVVRFPLNFQSGIMRARFAPHDGQLYVAGLRGWQTTGVKNGCLQRVRYTGAQTRMPIRASAKKDGVELEFACSLDTQSAASVDNWNVEIWRYQWSAAYGSPEFSTLTEIAPPEDTGKNGTRVWTKTQSAAVGHDPLTVKEIAIGTDDRTVFLVIPGLKPVDQISIRYTLKAADGTPMKGEYLGTIHALKSAE